MGNIILLKPFLPALPEKVSPRRARTIPVGPATKEACVALFNGEDPAFRALVEGVDKVTSITGKVRFDDHHMVLAVLAYFGKNGLESLTSIPQIEGKIGDAIATWMREEKISRRSRRLAAKHQAMIAVEAAE
jgi:hypothetical protein